MLLGMDGALFLVAHLNGDLHLGSAPILDVWDLLKSFTAGLLLFRASFRLRSRGLAVFGAAFVVVGLVDSAAIHAPLATAFADVVPFDQLVDGGVPPHIQQGIAELVVLVALGVVVGIALVTSRDTWPGYPRAFKALMGCMLGLLFFAVVVDFIDGLFGRGIWALVEEIGEAAILSVSVAYVAFLKTTGLPFCGRQRGS